MIIFVSYSRKDARDIANLLNINLSSFNYDIFTDFDDIRAGENWSNSIEENISKCDIFVVIVTYGALHSPHVEREVLQAQREKKTIIPCFYRSVLNTDIKWRLNDIQGVEFSDKYELARDLYPKVYHDSSSKSIDRNPPSKVAYHGSSSKSKYRNPPSISPQIDTSSLALFPTEESKILLVKGIDLSVTKNKNEEALEYFNKVLQISPHNYFALHFKGMVLSSQGKYQDALECYDKVLQINPNYTAVQGVRELALKYRNKKFGLFRFFR